MARHIQVVALVSLLQQLAGSITAQRSHLQSHEYPALEASFNPFVHGEGSSSNGSTIATIIKTTTQVQIPNTSAINSTLTAQPTQNTNLSGPPADRGGSSSGGENVTIVASLVGPSSTHTYLTNDGSASYYAARSQCAVFWSQHKSAGLTLARTLQAEVPVSFRSDGRLDLRCDVQHGKRTHGLQWDTKDCQDVKGTTMKRARTLVNGQVGTTQPLQSLHRLLPTDAIE